MNEPESDTSMEPAGHDAAPESAETPVDSLATAMGKKLALAVAGAGLDKKAVNIEIIDVSGKVDYTEYLVLMTGRSNRHVSAIAAGIQQELKEQLGLRPLSTEGAQTSSWVLLDYNDVVVHVFQREARIYYDLEGLWIDATRVSVPEPERKPAAEDA